MKALTDILYRLKNGKDTNFKGLGVISTDKNIYLYFYSADSIDSSFRLAESEDGFNFKRSELNPSIYDMNNKLVNVEGKMFLSFFIYKKLYYLFFSEKDSSNVFYSTSNHLVQWKVKGRLNQIKGNLVLFQNFIYKKSFVGLTGESKIKTAFSKNFVDWEVGENYIFDYPIVPELAFTVKNNLVLIYHKEDKVFLAILDPKNPEKIIQSPDKPLWVQPAEWQNKKSYFIGTVVFNNKIIGYWGVEGMGIYAVVYTLIENIHSKKNILIKLAKSKENPILVPRKDYQWESVATFNPAALYEKGKVHLVYRAVGEAYISTLGYAASNDGVNINYRSDNPIYSHLETNHPVEKKQFNPPLYWSGGGFGGAEDPRLTKIDNKVYMTYVAYSNYEPPRVALTSIDLNDFLNQRWLWERPVIISPPNIVDKNAVIFPEKINGKYVIMHRIFPNILIDFVNDLKFDGKRYLKGEFKIGPRPQMWDSRKVGAGAPPIRTKYGWLLIYHAVGDQDSSRYKIGAMLLDIDNPTKVLHRTNNPILEPLEPYENEGFKYGVAYPCGAVVLKNNLFVYYGGADMVTCVATANLYKFLDDLRLSESGRLEPVNIAKINHV